MWPTFSLPWFYSYNENYHGEYIQRNNLRKALPLIVIVTALAIANLLYMVETHCRDPTH